jgi:hypothetical protein
MKIWSLEEWKTHTSGSIDYYSEDYKGPLRIGKDTNLTLDITYHCNMACTNCNRLSNVKNKPRNNLSLKDIKIILLNLIHNKNPVKTIIISGGEPTVHPEFLDIIKLVGSYCATFGIFCQLLTNGGLSFLKVKDKLPENIQVLNSSKQNNTPFHFKFTIAPIDLGVYDPEDNPCRESITCGRALNKNGYFVCSSAAAIDNFLNLNLGISGFENATEENLRNRAKDICKYCGTYLREKKITGAFGGHDEKQEVTPFWESKLKF